MSSAIGRLRGQAIRPLSLADLFHRAAHAELGPDPARLRVGVCFLTTQAARPAGRSTGYRNNLLSVRVEAAVGSCSIEQGELSGHGDVIGDCIGAPVSELLRHPLLAVRVATLDAYLMHVCPHPYAGASDGSAVQIPAGSCLDKSLARARVVVDLLPSPPCAPVLVVGVVNSLLARLRELAVPYIPCDLTGQPTEWGEAVHTDALAELGRCRAVLATGMTLGNGTFDGLLQHARLAELPVVMFAQTGSAVLPWFLGRPGLHAVSAEPYPFYTLDGEASTLFHYGTRASS